MSCKFQVIFDDSAYEDKPFMWRIHMLASLSGVTIIREGICGYIGKHDTVKQSTMITRLDCSAPSLLVVLFTRLIHRRSMVNCEGISVYY